MSDGKEVTRLRSFSQGLPGHSEFGVGRNINTQKKNNEGNKSANSEFFPNFITEIYKRFRGITSFQRPQYIPHTSPKACLWLWFENNSLSEIVRVRFAFKMRFRLVTVASAVNQTGSYIHPIMC